MSKILKNNDGISALILTFIVGGVVMEIVLSGLFISYFLGQTGFGAKLSSEALGAARAGIDDGILKLIRDKNFTTNSSFYNLTMGSASAEIAVCKDMVTVVSLCDTPAQGILNPESYGKDEITSIGAALTKRRKLKAAVNIDKQTGEIQLEEVREEPL